MTLPLVILKPKRDASIQRKHPWVFSGAIHKIILTEDEANLPEEGDLVQVLNAKEQFLGIGHWGESSIAVRLLSFEETTINKAFFIEKFQSALNLRKSLNLYKQDKTSCYRLVHAEGDSLPGLIIDIYNDVAVVQAHSRGMAMAFDAIAEALKQVLNKEINAIYSKSEQTLPKQYSSEFPDSYLWRSDKQIAQKTTVKENNLLFEIDWIEGQKTGFFIDQRENRFALQKYVEGKSVLNTFCYSGGFSVYALGANAKSVDSVDSSAKAIELCNRNVELNFPKVKNHRAIAQDTFSFLNESEEKYDVILLDPPAYAKSKSAKHNAIQGYRRLNEKALRMINSGGILFTFSCSQIIHRKLFEDTITAAAIDAGRSVRILEHLSQPADHPVNIFHPEGEYLKGLVLFVE
ncbi:MAG: class I SAM-dependent rRNA methyltransferase [Bacteroidetes bacterium]|nr:MAG: class I SAM-dependent rRNA methyltransferase [Bacteroidota bacterium]MBL1144590.1 class I SAM-dependent rRNA methyltransferase [Bacteroidota bacterium]MCB0802251.1 class I SAM-dependent rRNA methyltransferase [Flavobacteriales bacterium]NOG57385.1 class I SAM-dependent rRNA methyltransferase [Bacteroidota bacterium]